MKKSFILYLDQQELFNKLPDEAAGKLIKHIFAYVNCENPTTDDLLTDIAFTSIKAALKRDLSKWDTQLKQRSDAGKASAKARQLKAAKDNSTTVKSRSTKTNEEARNPTDNVSVSVNDKDKEINKEKNKGKRIRFLPPTVSDVETYARQKNLNLVGFHDHYESNGWLVGKNKMKDWQAAARGWSSRQFGKPRVVVDNYADLVL